MKLNSPSYNNLAGYYCYKVSDSCRRGFYLAEKMGEVYEAYDMEVQGTGRGRGAVILMTDKGVRQVSSLNGTDERLQQEKEFKDKIYEKGFCNIDRVVANREDELVTCDRYGNPFVCREYFQGRECNASSIRDLEKAVINLAWFHRAGRELYMEENTSYTKKTPGNLDRKVNELRRIRNFVSRRTLKNDFEMLYIKTFDYFYSQAEKCLSLFQDNFTYNDKWLGYCHGSYNYHSVMFCDGYIATINFDRFHVGYQLMDLYQFLRKAMEKNRYDITMAKDILSAYSQINYLEHEDYEFIYLMYSFPEKFWKISNRYMNTRKSYISPVLMEKLQKVIEDDQEKLKILSEINDTYGLHKLTN